ncbi:MAG: twin-arginine translocase subunit TatC [Planctomycetes bacterium]|nr:twin-arginine translocase subunit TatC [Planctomycetota bacterium]
MTKAENNNANDELPAGSVMSFGDHIEELRKSIVMAFLGLGVIFIVSLFYQKPLMEFVMKPYHYAAWGIMFYEDEPKVTLESVLQGDSRTSERIVVKRDRSGIRTRDAGGNHILLPAKPPSIYIFDPLGRFVSFLKICFAATLLLSAPWMTYQLFRFIGPGLYKRERGVFYTYMPVSFLLFLAGAAFGYLLLIPAALHELFFFGGSDLGGSSIENVIGLDTYLAFFISLTMVIGMTFQLPLVMIGLTASGIVKAQFFSKYRKPAIAIIAFVSMVVTPSDVFSMIFLMIPALALYEIGIIVCKRKERAMLLAEDASRKQWERDEKEIFGPAAEEVESGKAECRSQNAEVGMQNAEAESGNAEGRMLNAEVAPQNPEIPSVPEDISELKERMRRKRIEEEAAQKALEEESKKPAAETVVDPSLPDALKDTLAKWKEEAVPGDRKLGDLTMDELKELIAKMIRDN